MTALLGRVRSNSWTWPSASIIPDLIAMTFRDNHGCFVCGKDNPDGLHLEFEPEGTFGVRTSFVIPARFQGFAGIAHGGILATILDECMVNALWLRGNTAVTARLEVRLRRPVRVGERVTFRAQVVRESSRGFAVTSQATLDDGTVVADAKALLVKVGGKAQPG
jgi:acyl-coenzyme A thioesterase PaaI-like protein